MRRPAALSIALLLLWLVSVGGHAAIPLVSAASGPDCSWYDYQPDAQYDLDQVIENFPSILATFAQLDPDGDGVACPELPARPQIIEEAQRVRGHVDPGFDFIGIEASGYSAWYDVQLAGVSLDPDANRDARNAACPELVSNEAIAGLFALPDGVARQYYLASATSDPLPPGDADGRFAVTALAWTVIDDPAGPMLINDWLIRSGIAFADADTADGDLLRDLEEAQEAAREAGIGVWGDCALPGQLTTSPAMPDGRIVRESGRGDQVVTFSVGEEGTYVVTLDAGADTVVFVAVDVYTVGGEWLPELSITAGEAGAFSAASYLASGDYYVQVKAIGAWRLTIDRTE